MRKLLLAALLLAGCDAAAMHAPPPPPRERVVFNEIKILPDGGTWSIKVDAGTYRVDMTADANGAHVEWIGATGPACPQEAVTYTGKATFARTGQVVVSNPTTFGLGKAVSTTLTITRLPR